MVQRILVTVRVILAWSLIFLNVPLVPAQEFGVVEDVYVGRHTISPFGGIGRYQNLLLRSEEYDNASWVKTNVAAITANGITGPDGTASAEALAPATAAATNAKQTSGTTAAASTAYTFSIWAKVPTGTKNVILTVGDDGATVTTNTATAALTTDWERFKVSYTATATPDGSVFVQVGDATWTADTIHLWGAQLEQIPSGAEADAGVYVKTVASAVSTASRGLVSNTDLLVAGTQVTSSGLVDATKLTGVVPVANGGTGLSSTTANQLLYSSANNTIGGLATGNSGVLVTSGAGVPSIATDIPTGVTIGAKYIYRADGTDVPVADGGTGASTLTGIVLGNGTSAFTTTANNSTNWDTAYTDRLKWDGGSTDLVAATGRTSLGLAAGGAGDIWVEKAGDTMTGNLTVQNTAPQVTFDDTTASAKDLLVKTDGDKTYLQEAAGTDGSLLALDLTNNRLGIGTAAPDATLSIKGVGGTFKISDNAMPANTANFFNNFAGWLGVLIKPSSAGTGDRLSIQDENGNVEFIVKDGGNVGIGTTSPTQKLHVVGNILASGAIYANNQTTYGISGNDIYMDTINTGVTNDPLELNYRTAGPVKICASVACATYSAYFDTTGNVGIGTTDPLNAIDIKNNDGIRWRASSASQNSFVMEEIDVGSTTLALRYKNPTSVYKELIAFNFDGNVGIGTTSPNAKLTIANNVATGALDNYSEYQQILYDTGSPTTSYGFGIRGGTMVFNSDFAYQFDEDGSTQVTIASGGNVTITGSVTSDMYRMTNFALLNGGVTALTKAQMQSASVFPVTTLLGAFTVTMFSDVANNSLDAADIGRTFRFIFTGGTNTFTLALDADLSLITMTAVAAGGMAIEDLGDYIECFVLTTDIVVCTTYEAD